MREAQYAAAKLELAQAHGVATGADVLVAVIDSGVDRSHPAHRAALEAHRGRGAPDDIVDILGVEVVAVLEGGEDRGR